MNFLAVSAAILALGIYTIIAIEYVRGEIRDLSLSTYLLWCLLDVIAAASLFKHGAWTLPATYAFGCVIVMTPLLKTRKFSWTWLDTAITMMVIISIIVWTLVGSTAATIVSTMGVVIASIPQAWKIWSKPKDATIWIWVGYTLSNSMSTIAGKDWSIQERFYPGACTVTTAVILLFALRKYGKTAA